MAGFPLSLLKVGRMGRVRALSGEGALKRRLLDMGFVPGTTVRMLKKAPFGDPVQVRLRGYSLTLRTRDAKDIWIEEVDG
ncbi:MAG: FeoA family protein [Christensenellales bacterium]|jgi:ferrous iron transport protein A